MPAVDEMLVQECGAGLVRVRRRERLALAAPPLVRSGPVDEPDLRDLAGALRIAREDIVDATWADNGPGWVAVLLADAAAVLSLRPDVVAMGDWKIGVAGLHPVGAEVQLEVRAFVPSMGIAEDPVTGSLNASLGQWLAGSRLPASYVAAQGTAIGRAGRIHVTREGDDVWVAGDTRTIVSGRVEL